MVSEKQGEICWWLLRKSFLFGKRRKAHRESPFWSIRHSFCLRCYPVRTRCLELWPSSCSHQGKHGGHTQCISYLLLCHRLPHHLIPHNNMILYSFWALGSQKWLIWVVQHSHGCWWASVLCWLLIKSSDTSPHGPLQGAAYEMTVCFSQSEMQESEREEERERERERWTRNSVNPIWKL